MATRIGAFKIRELENFFVPILQNCKNIVELKSIHARVIKYSLSQSNFLVTKMVDVCDKSEDLGYASLLFNQVKEPNGTIVSWTAMISGYTRFGSYADALDVFRQMQIVGVEPDEISIISVLPACAQLGALEVGKMDT
ncbi:REPEAT-CONTAINING PROTEIN putative-RELATED [Salix viminalis]|uniref:REPEAT-CONTAINING PROTEIN putative-RELATED n=1 Tax=Salix viminalis TaxID=40686 RepID=A0A9Q0NQG8_SALVM|nr:REPEAT-CONTAINING PROTEIN putative-RELATED [Salix viminalis]